MVFKKGNTFWNHPNAIKNQFKKGRIFSRKLEIKRLKNLHIKLFGIKRSEEDKIKISDGNKGKIIPRDTRLKMSLAKEGYIPWIKGKHHKEESKEKNRIAHLRENLSKEIRRKMKKHRSNQILPMKDSSIEVKIQKFLKELGIEFMTHQYIKEIEHGYQCDILIPYLNMVIECDGDYWHNYPIGRDIDHVRTSELLKKGFKVLRLWEFEINKISIEEFKLRIDKISSTEIYAKASAEKIKKDMEEYEKSSKC